MKDLSTTYMGVKLANPIIVGASGLTSNIAAIRDMEAAGAGAIVTKTLFEEQIQLERLRFDEDREKYNCRNAEMAEVFPHTAYQGPREHLMWVREAKKAVKIPVFASLNAVNRDTWLEYAGLLEETGVDGLEVDILASPEDSGTAPGTIENDQFELVAELKRTVSIPVSVKLGSSYTDVLHMIRLMDRAGADAFVLFNRPFVPDIDLHELKVTSPMAFSDATDARPALRCVALLEGNINADVCCGTGVADGEQAVKMILAGATAVQVVSALYRYGVPHIRAMLAAMDKWMETNRYARLTDFRGMLSRRHVPDPWAYTRNQYVKILMNTDRIIRNAPVI